MKKRIALLIGASIYNQKGLFNAAHERAKHLIQVTNAQIDLFLISSYKSEIGRILSRDKKLEKPDYFTKDGLTYRIIWIKSTLLDYILVHKFNKRRFDASREFKRHLPLFKDYDLIAGHTVGSYIWQIYSAYNVPYIITWHGTDIHTTPFLSQDFFNEAKQLIEHAASNFFVSEALLKHSDAITLGGKKYLAYNGKDESFVSYSTHEKLKLKKLHSVEGKRIIAFVGNLIPVKNISCLPDIFSNIYEQEKDAEFWIIGNGPLFGPLKKQTCTIPIRFWGPIDHEQMIDFMNMMDILVLPSLNEGLPLVTIEALSCGCHVVGSRVGGIPESIGFENTVPLDDPDFTRKIADRVLEILKSKPTIIVDKRFDWCQTAKFENRIITKILES